MMYWVGTNMRSVEGGNLDRSISETEESGLRKGNLVERDVGGRRFRVARGVVITPGMAAAHRSILKPSCSMICDVEVISSGGGGSWAPGIDSCIWNIAGDTKGL
jgi:hypothetical protein